MEEFRDLVTALGISPSVAHALNQADLEAAQAGLLARANELQKHLPEGKYTLYAVFEGIMARDEDHEGNLTMSEAIYGALVLTYDQEGRLECMMKKKHVNPASGELGTDAWSSRQAPLPLQIPTGPQRSTKESVEVPATPTPLPAAAADEGPACGSSALSLSAAAASLRKGDQASALAVTSSMMRNPYCATIRGASTWRARSAADGVSTHGASQVGEYLALRKAGVADEHSKEIVRDLFSNAQYCRYNIIKTNITPRDFFSLEGA